MREGESLFGLARPGVSSSAGGHRRVRGDGHELRLELVALLAEAHALLVLLREPLPELLDDRAVPLLEVLEAPLRRGEFRRRRRRLHRRAVAHRAHRRAELAELLLARLRGQALRALPLSLGVRGVGRGGAPELVRLGARLREPRLHLRQRAFEIGGGFRRALLRRLHRALESLRRVLLRLHAQLHLHLLLRPQSVRRLRRPLKLQLEVAAGLDLLRRAPRRLGGDDVRRRAGAPEPRVAALRALGQSAEPAQVRARVGVKRVAPGGSRD